MTPSLSVEPERAERIVLRRFVLTAVVAVLGSLPLGLVLLGPAFVDGFRSGSPPIVASRLDAFLPAMLAGLAAAAFGGGIVASGDGLRGVSRESRLWAVWFCIGLALLLGIGLYVIVGWGLPLLSQQALFPAGLPPERALDVHPFLLTTPQLYEVQASFRKIGGFSDRVAQTAELRVWLSLSMLAFAPSATILMLAERPRLRLLRVAAVELVAIFFLLVAMMATLGPALFLRPRRLPLNVAWVVVGTMGLVCFWWLRRRLASPDAVTSVTSPPSEAAASVLATGDPDHVDSQVNG